MVCSLCGCSGHNKRTCDITGITGITASERRVATELNATLPVPKSKAPHALEGLDGCVAMFKEPKVLKAKKVAKVIEGLSGSPAMVAMFKEPKVLKAKKVAKVIEGLSGSPAMVAMFKEPKVLKAKKVAKVIEGLSGSPAMVAMFKEPASLKPRNLTNCSGCGGKGHNSRTCVSACIPCSPPKSLCFAGLSAEQAVNLVRIVECQPAY